MTKKLLFVFFSVFFLPFIKGQIISKQFEISFSSIDIDINIGQCKRNEGFDVNVAIDFLWVSSSIYLPEVNNTIEEVRTEYIFISSNYSKARLVKGDIILTGENENVTVKSFPFYYVEDIIFDAFDSFPLQYQFKDESFSPVHLLYNQHLISERGFGLVFNETNKFLGTLYFGGIPPQILNKYPYVATFKVDNEFSTWGCEVSEVILNEHVFNQKFYGYFQTNEKHIFAPKAYYDFLRKTYFKDLLENHTCSFEETSESIEYECKCDQIHNDTKLTIFLEGIPFTFTKQDLFSGETVCSFNVELNFNNINQWKLGFNFYQKYVSYFNYDKQEIKLYSDSPFIPNKRNNLLLPVILFNLLINMVMIPPLVYNKFKNFQLL